MNFKEMKEKTKIVVIGVINQFNEYHAKTGNIYHSMDLIVNSQKAFLKVGLPEDYDRQKMKEGELVQVEISIREFNGRTSFDMVVA